MAEIGDMMCVQVIIEGSMNSSNPYFSSSWRRNFAVCLKLFNVIKYMLLNRLVDIVVSNYMNLTNKYSFLGDKGLSMLNNYTLLTFNNDSLVYQTKTIRFYSFYMVSQSRLVNSV